MSDQRAEQIADGEGHGVSNLPPSPSAPRAGGVVRKPIRLTPGQYVMTEWKGRFFAVGSVVVEDLYSRQARCCDEGHDNPDDIDECWEKR